MSTDIQTILSNIDLLHTRKNYIDQMENKTLSDYLAEKAKETHQWVIYHKIIGPNIYWGGVELSNDDFLTLPYLFDNSLFGKPITVKLGQDTKTAIFGQPHLELFPEKNQYVYQGTVFFDGIESKYMYWML